MEGGREREQWKIVVRKCNRATEIGRPCERERAMENDQLSKVKKSVSDFPILALVAPTPHASLDFHRRSAKFHPSIWGDHFIQYVSKPMEVDNKMEKQIITLKEKVRKMLAPAKEKASRPLTFEKERGHVSSALECYMKQYSVTKQDAIDEFQRQVINAWKNINEECLEPIEVPKSLLESRQHVTSNKCALQRWR
ncbi:unnamed protein product [Lupinus luteus]|uniref:Terpene synthase metal-binding domain-containing protein n=1 Tax=Lupinus luteus TaxID=3873 RepID=A0AAV1XP74_LUPLU